MTRFPLRFLFLAAGLLAIVLVGSTAAQKTPAVPGVPLDEKSTTPDEVKTKKKTPTSALTNESLAEMLDNMGYDYRTDTLPSGGVIYTIRINANDWNFTIEVSLSQNNSLVWLIAPLHQLPPAGTVPGEAVVRLLQENWQINPHVFAIPKNSRLLYLQRALENQNLTPARFRTAIDLMTGTIRSTAAIWDISKWGQTPPPSGPTNGGTAAYPDTTEGLTKLSKDLLAIAKAGKRAELTAKVKKLALPNSDAWFKRVFGAEAGAALAEEYTAGLQDLEANLTRVFMTAAEENLTDVNVFKFSQPDAANATATQKKAMESMVVKTPLYSVYFSQAGEERGMHLYSFVYVEGAFRMVGKMKAATVRVAGFAPANGQDDPKPRTDVFGLAQAQVGQVNALQPMERDITGTWVNSGGVGPYAPRMVMQINRNGTYYITANVGNDSGRYTVVGGVILAQSNSGLRSRIYVSWMGPDLASFGFKPDDDYSRPVWLTFARMRGLAAAPEAHPQPRQLAVPNGEKNGKTNELVVPFNPQLPFHGFFPDVKPTAPLNPGTNELKPDNFRHLMPFPPFPGLTPQPKALDMTNSEKFLQQPSFWRP